MAARSFPFGAAVVIGAGLAGIGASKAAEVRPGGRLSLTLSGFAAFQAHGGALDDQREDPDLSTGLDVSTDTELHLVLRGKDDATGLDYGGTVEVEADTNAARNTEESWLFVRGGFGELRLGDEEGPVDESALGAATVAAGTGGIDGEVIDEIAVDAVLPSNSDVATKIRYYTPTWHGLQLGVSWTPNAEDVGDGLAPREVDIGDWIEGALVYKGEFDEVELEASLVGSRAKVKNRDSDSFEGEGRSRVWTWYAGAVVELPEAGLLPGVEIGAGFGDESVGGLEKRYLNAGLGVELGPVSTSLTYGRVLRTAGYPDLGEPWNLVLSADTELLPGVVLAGDVARFDNDLDPDAEMPTGNDRGWVWVARLEVEF